MTEVGRKVYILSIEEVLNCLKISLGENEQSEGKPVDVSLGLDASGMSKLDLGLGGLD